MRHVMYSWRHSVVELMTSSLGHVNSHVIMYFLLFKTWSIWVSGKEKKIYCKWNIINLITNKELSVQQKH